MGFGEFDSGAGDVHRGGDVDVGVNVEVEVGGDVGVEVVVGPIVGVGVGERVVARSVVVAARRIERLRVDVDDARRHANASRAEG